MNCGSGDLRSVTGSLTALSCQRFVFLLFGLNSFFIIGLLWWWHRQPHFEVFIIDGWLPGLIVNGHYVYCSVCLSVYVCVLETILLHVTFLYFSHSVIWKFNLLSLSLSNVIIFIWYVMWQSVYLCVLGVQYYTILILRDSHHSFHS